MIFRRKDPAREEAKARFGPVADAVDRAQRTLLTAVPTSRHPGTPLAEALQDFAAALTLVTGAMDTWRHQAVPEQWENCAAGLEAAGREAGSLRANPPGPTEFEQLNSRIGDVMAHLDVFAEVERRLR